MLDVSQERMSCRPLLHQQCCNLSIPVREPTVVAAARGLRFQNWNGVSPHPNSVCNSLHRMLSPKAIQVWITWRQFFDAIRKCLKVSLKAQTVNLQKVA